MESLTIASARLRVDETDLRISVSQYGSLINLATPVMQHLPSIITGSGSVVLLCSGEGFILHSMGDPDFLPKAQQIALKPGSRGRKTRKGECDRHGHYRAPSDRGLCRASLRPDQPFPGCSAAPCSILLAALPAFWISRATYRYHQRHTLALVQMSVRVIERQMFQHRFGRDLVFKFIRSRATSEVPSMCRLRFRLMVNFSRQPRRPAIS
jgi:transcriptional regulator of acetoin/glycerol metabolism